MSKLMLALVDGHLSAVPHSAHVLGVAPADSPLTPRQPSQTSALGVRQDGDTDLTWRYGVGR